MKNASIADISRQFLLGVLLLCEFVPLSSMATNELYPPRHCLPAITEAPAIWQDPAQPLEARVEDLMEKLTLEERVDLLTVAASTRFKGIPRFGIPTLISSDGPRGPHGPVGYPCGISMGASFDPALVCDEASAMGQECRAKGIGMLYGPAININRDPLAGRFFEYYTEDPCLNAKLAVAFVRGLQSQKVSACLKHFACNNRDWNRNNYLSMVDSRALHEIYFPAFKAAIEEANAMAVMTAANGLNGEFCSDSHYLLTEVLRDSWGFKGFVLTDGIGSKSTIPAALAGLDISNQGQPAKSLFGSPLLAAVRSGAVPEKVINEKVRRILRVMAWSGNLNRGGIHPEGTFAASAHEELALRGAEEGLVLLKDSRQLLPLDRTRIKSVLVLGPNADQRFCQPGLGGSSWVYSPDEVTILEGIRGLVNSNNCVRYVPRDQLGGFQPLDGRFARAANQQPGFDAQYFNGPIAGSPVLTRLEKEVNFNWEMKSPDVTRINSDKFTAQFTTTIDPPASGAYTLRIRTDNDASLHVDRVGGAPIAVATRQKGSAEALATVQMVKGIPFFLRLDYHKEKGDAFLNLDWAVPSSGGNSLNHQAELVKEIKRADAVIFVGGIDNSLDAEGRDRLNMDFPQWQEDLINQLGQLNSKLVVVLINGSPLKIGGWLDHVPAVIEAWYAGSQAGNAVAKALFGEITPSGRLPFTWPKQLEDSPAHAVGTEDSDTVNYREGVFVGYRYYLTRKVFPEFPFGYGLSYTRFSYSDLTVNRTNDFLTASVRVTNLGPRPGAEVAQFYIHPGPSTVERPERELKGFQKVFLKPGETAALSVRLKPEDFAFFDVDRQAWRVTPGKYEVQVGASSTDIRLKRVVSMGETLIKD
jgi:beta-glucosidase